MLGRTAASLFWMSRYVERAENMARLLEVGYRISLMPRAIDGHRDEWRSTLTSAACETSYFSKHEDDHDGEGDRPSALRRGQPLERALLPRDGAQQWPRGAHRAHPRCVGEPQRHLERVRADQAAEHHRRPAARLPRLDQAARHAVPRRAARHASCATTPISSASSAPSSSAPTTRRASSTSNTTSCCRKPSDVGCELDIQQWATILRSVSAHRAYRWFYRDSRYRPWIVAEFLILREEMPRSLVFCYHGSTRSLDGLGELYGERLRLPRGGARNLR